MNTTSEATYTDTEGRTWTRNEYVATVRKMYLDYGYKPAGAASKARIAADRVFGKAKA